MTILNVSKLTKRYDQRSVKGVSDISFNLKANEKLFIVGPSGSGKTTLLNLLAQEFDPDSGIINCDSSQKIVKLNTELENDINISVFQYLTESIKDDIAPEESENLIRSNLSYFELTNEIHQNVNTLSTGQKQRLCLVKFFNENPTIALFDEPFSNIDFTLRDEIMSLINEYLKDKDIASIWVTHDIAFVLEYAQETLILNHGEMVAYGNINDLYFRPPNIFTAKVLAMSNPIMCSSNKIEIFNRPYSLDDELLEDISDEIVFLIRPDQIHISQDGEYKAKVLESKFKGHYYSNLLEIDNKKLRAYSPSKQRGAIKFTLDKDLYFIRGIQ